MTQNIFSARANSVTAAPPSLDLDKFKEASSEVRFKAAMAEVFPELKVQKRNGFIYLNIGKTSSNTAVDTAIEKLVKKGWKQLPYKGINEYRLAKGKYEVSIGESGSIYVLTPGDY